MPFSIFSMFYCNDNLGVGVIWFVQDNIYHERDRPCPNAHQGCTERVSDADLHHHIKYECRAHLREVSVPTRDYRAPDVSDMVSVPD